MHGVEFNDDTRRYGQRRRDCSRAWFPLPFGRGWNGYQPAVLQERDQYRKSHRTPLVKYGTLLATATFSGEGSSGWQQVDFSTPVSITANTTYVASYFAPNGHYSANNSFFASTGVDNAPLHALKDGLDGANGVYNYGASAFPASTFQSSNYWVDVVFVPTASTTPPTITSVSPANNSSGASLNAVLTATFSRTDERVDDQWDHFPVGRFRESPGPGHRHLRHFE